MKRNYNPSKSLLFLALVACFSSCTANEPTKNNQSSKEIRVEQPIQTGAEQTTVYFPYLQGKRIAIVANQTSRIDTIHIIDSLISSGIKVKTVFAPEHGFKGDFSAGVEIENDHYGKQEITIQSLYGRKRIPSEEDLASIDVVIFDIQDVGCRFYTYINVLRDVMYACAKYKTELLVLDRPNPNGYLVDGPVLDMELKSGIGQFPIPIAYGMTIGEFAQMINGEYWLKDSLQCPLKVIPLKNYDHKKEYILPIAPSPNLNTQQSIMLYPSTCLFEGTILNHGRGTMFPFSVIGSPELKGQYTFSYTPKSIPGMCESPLHQDKLCYGIDLREYDFQELIKGEKINLEWMIDLYNAHPNKSHFFDSKMSHQIGDINLLAGSREFKLQIQKGESAQEIRESWEPALSLFKAKREKYLLYP